MGDFLKVWLFLLGFFFSAGGQSYTDPAVARLFKSTEKYYSGKSMNLDFSYAVKVAESRETVEKGNLIFTDEWYRLILPDQQIYFDGTTQWSYFTDRKEVQITSSTLGESAFHPLKFAGLYRKTGFRTRIVYEDGNIAVAELVPDKREEEYHRLKITLDKASHQIRKIEVYLKNGDRYKIELKKHIIRKSLIKNDFQLRTDTLRGVHIEDLR